ncbi:hypothetical protein Nepgr_015354 [Nepenthes gracilis]|uniref:Uncharacterized protein n=1 Tax=Nepenthes gracilis TaxID=150966 RepID=A0AAD3XQM6_NEPGR|nr:hypothetical protein Nepgr_015354 [Nepenthes gracilis]
MNGLPFRMRKLVPVLLGAWSQFYAILPSKDVMLACIDSEYRQLHRFWSVTSVISVQTWKLVASAADDQNQYSVLPLAISSSDKWGRWLDMVAAGTASR